MFLHQKRPGNRLFRIFRKTCLLNTLLLVAGTLAAQKKPLDHTVYDGWEAVQERLISNNGQWAVFTVNPQEGDGKLVIAKTDGSWSQEIPRGYNATISSSSNFVVFKIKPTFKETRDARIKKKRPDEMPKDSLGWVELGKTSINKIARVKNYRMPVEANWVACHLEKALPDSAAGAGRRRGPNAAPAFNADSAKKVIDSLKMLLEKFPEKVKLKYLGNDGLFADADEPAAPGAPGADEGSELLLLDLAAGTKKSFKNVSDFIIDSVGGKKLVLRTAKPARDSLAKPAIIYYTVVGDRSEQVLRGFNDVKNLKLDDNGEQLAFVAERDSAAKALQKFYKLYYYKPGMDSAKMIADKNSAKTSGWGISEFGRPDFSKSGRRLFFGTAPILPAKDTLTPDFEKVSVDIWNYKDDYLQTAQLKTADRDLRRSYQNMYDVSSGSIVQLASKNMETIQLSDEGDGNLFIGTDNRSYRVESQWTGRGKTDIYTINPATGESKLLKAGVDGFASLSPTGKYVAWYDSKAKNYFTWKDGVIKNISAKIKTKLYDEDFDMPDDPNAYGSMSWHESDDYLYVYDRFDIWKLDAAGVKEPVCITAGLGRKNNLRLRYQRLDPEERFVKDGQPLLLTVFNEVNKKAAVKTCTLGEPFTIDPKVLYPLAISAIRKAKNAGVYLYSTETPQRSPNVEVATNLEQGAYTNAMGGSSKILYQPNPQQSNYNWMTADLIEWKAYDGKMTQGILYKPENFDPKKKYPLISYFYETLSDGLYNYQAPAPTPSRLNIPFFVSRGYLVLAPDIHYKTGQPGQDAYNYIVSGVRYVVKMGIADSTKLGLQGQSWGGYQTAQIITMTPLFAAAWAGAPVANMTSAYGGIRWESGLNRQFQYEKTQSRIGATLWEKPELYIRNSPLFHLPKVKTPTVIMSNDADGAVPWYQGIEMFTAMRRLGKPVWLLNYNGEAHNLVERKNRKDIQIREQQFFDWLLKGEPAPVWITTGVPAVEKGRNWGL